MSGFWGMRCIQVVSIAPSGVDPAYWCQCGARGLQINGLLVVPPTGGTTSAAIKAEGKCLLARKKQNVVSNKGDTRKGPISREKVAAVRG